MKITLLTQTVVMKFQWHIMCNHADWIVEIHNLLMHRLVIILSRGGFSFHAMTPIPL